MALIIGVIGCGKQAAKHVPALKRLGHHVRVYDSDKTTARRFAEDFHVEHAMGFLDLLDPPVVDAIDVCCPTMSHANAIVFAVENQKHFFCEKPMAADSADVRKIQRAMEEHPEPFGMIGYPYQFHPAMELVHSSLTNGTLGTPHFATLRLGGRGGHQEWKHSAVDGGGAINELLVHLLDLSRWFFGPVTEVKTLVKDVLQPERFLEGGDGTEIQCDAEDLVVVELKTESGCRVLCQADLLTPSYMSTVEVQADNGSVFASILDYMPTLLFLKEARDGYQQGNNTLRYEHVNLFEKQLAYFAECVQSGSEPERLTVRESIEMWKVVEKIREAR